MMLLYLSSCQSDSVSLEKKTDSVSEVPTYSFLSTMYLTLLSLVFDSQRKRRDTDPTLEVDVLDYTIYTLCSMMCSPTRT